MVDDLLNIPIKRKNMGCNKNHISGDQRPQILSQISFRHGTHQEEDAVDKEQQGTVMSWPCF